MRTPGRGLRVVIVGVMMLPLAGCGIFPSLPPAAEGAILGGVGGAGAGALIDKNHRLVGAGLGAAGGALIGAGIGLLKGNNDQEQLNNNSSSPAPQQNYQYQPGMQ